LKGTKYVKRATPSPLKPKPGAGPLPTLRKGTTTFSKMKGGEERTREGRGKESSE